MATCDASTNGPEENTCQPEPEDDGMVVQQFCECPNCDHWTKSADWVTSPHLNFECQQTAPHREKKKQPLLRSEKYPGKTPKILSFNTDKLTKIEKQGVFRTLVHGEIIPQPIKYFADTYFSEDIQRSLKALNYKFSLPLQSFAWPAIFRQMNVFMIGGSKSGKTMAYLPAICTFSTMAEQKYEKLSKYKGPLIVIICSNSKQCEEILDLIKKLYHDVQVKPKISIVTYPITNVHNTDILITIPESLLHCLKSRIFNLKKLCHLVLEDTSILLKKFDNSIYKILEVVDEMLEHRPSNTKVQLIVTSEKWTTDLKKFHKSLFVSPLTCISNYLEAALYGNINFEVKFIMSEQKISYLIEILKDNFKVYKTVVICDNSELTKVNKMLVRKGIQTIALSDKSNKDEIEESEVEWNYMTGGQCKVLLCTDFVFETLLCINDAMWLIHYSFPSTWTRFMKRFSGLSSYYQSPWQPKEQKTDCKSFLIIDETCEEQMPRILNLVNRCTKVLPPYYQNYAEGFRVQNENSKIRNDVTLCNTLKLLGKCPDSLCEDRHLVSDEFDVSNDLPKSGKVVFKILNMKDVTQYTVQLIEHIDVDGTVCKINNDDLKKPLIYDNNAEMKRPRDIKIGHFYAHCDHTTKGTVYSLCHVLKTEKDNIDVKLTNGLTLQTLKAKLFEVPANLKIVDVYLCHLIPPFKDEYFSGRSFHVTRTSLESLEYKKIVFTGDIYLQLNKTLWLNNVVQMFKVDGIDVIKFNLPKYLTHLQVVETSKAPLTSLYKLCKNCDISLPNYVKQAVKKTVKIKDEEPQRAFLDDNINQVMLISAISPDEVYLRLAKFQSLLENLEKDIQVAVKSGVLNKKIDVEIGKYYLALDSRGQTYSRVRVLDVENEKALCFFVDYGDEAIVEISKLKFLPSKFVTKLPFQAIQCRLYGLTPAFGEWDDQATDVLYKYMFEPDSDIFRPLFVDVRSKDKGDMKRAKVKYSVIMKDGFDDSDLVINQLLLECGFATSIFHKIDDFEIPKPEVVEESSESDPGEDVGETIENCEDVDEDIEERFRDSDVEVFNAADLLEMFGIPKMKQKQMTPQLTYNANENIHPQEYTPNEEESNYLTPEVYWSQKTTNVTLKIKLIGVAKYKTNVVRKRIFTFATDLEGKSYELKFTLHKPALLGRHRALGQEVEVVLVKVEALDWLQLTGTTKRMRNIHYEVPDEVKKPKRKFLQLDITDDESDDNDAEKPMIHEISDLDSDFDEEIRTSSEED